MTTTLKKNTVFLFYPATDHAHNYRLFWTPFSLLALAGSLEHLGLKVIIADGNLLSDDEIQAKLLEALPHLLCAGISCMLGQQIANGLEFAGRVRRLVPTLPLVWGGPHPSLVPEAFVQDPCVDVLVRGQGEETFAELVAAFQHGQEYQHIPGTSLRQNHEIIHNPARAFRDVNTFPSWPWNLLDMESYICNDYKLNSRILAYVSSQGCPYGCGFCCENGINHRFWSGLRPERVVEDILWLKEHYSINGIKFNDSDFFVDHSRADKISRLLIEHKADIRWFASMHPKEALRFDDQGLHLLRASGCKRLLVGAESGSQEVLDLIHKGIRVSDIYTIAERFGRFGISINFTVIVGFPEVSPTEVEQTMHLAQRIKQISSMHDVKFHFYDPTPGSPFYAQAVQKGLSEPNNLRDWAEYDRHKVRTPWISHQAEKKVNAFSRLYIHLIHPSRVVEQALESQPSLRRIYHMLGMIAALRFKLDFYDFPFEWFFYRRVIQSIVKNKEPARLFKHL